MSVPDPDVPDPLNDPRTLQADPGAVAEGGFLSPAEDDATVTGGDELAIAADEPGGDDVAGGAAAPLPGDPMAPEDDAPDDLTGDDLTGGIAGA